MFDELSVAENIFMGHMPLALAGRVDWIKMTARARHMLKRLDADFDAGALLKQSRRGAEASGRDRPRAVA